MNQSVLRFGCLAFLVLAFAGCFDPQFTDRHIMCGPDDSCPPGLQCVGGYCSSSPQMDATSNFTLTVVLGGNAMGTVSSSPAGIDCGSSCSKAFPSGTMVSLTATPTSGSIFVGWSGACSGTGACSVSLDTNVSVTANFATDNSLVVALAGNGSGIVSSNPAGISCGADCSEQFAANTTVTLTAFPATGSQFDGWSGAGCSGVGTCVVTTDTAKMVTATFSLTQHTLSVSLTGNGSGVVTSPSPTSLNCGSSCTATVNYNAMVTLTAAPNTGSTFTGWTGGGCSGTNTTCTVTVTQATNVTAGFTLTQHTVTVTKAGNGAGTVTSNPTGISCGSDCSEPYDYGTTVTLSATPAAGSTFTGWSGGTCTGTAACVISISQAENVTATFTLNTYNLDVLKTGNGTGTVMSDVAGINCGTDCTENYNYGTMVTLTATTTTGTTFNGWSGGGCTGTGPCVVTVSAATTVTANFTLQQFLLTVGTTGTGSGTITGIGINCGADCLEMEDYGTTVTLTAAAAAGSSFAGWTGGGCTGTGTCVVSMTQAQSVSASFTLSTYPLTVTKAGTGAGTVTTGDNLINCGADCTEVYGFGTTVTLTAVATTGSVFSGWSGGVCSGTAPCQVTISSAANVTATFTLTQKTLTTNVTGGGTCTITSNITGINCGVDCSEPYDYGTAVTLSAAPASGSIFVGWTAPAGCTGNGTCDVTMDANKTATANCIVGTKSLTVTKAGNGQGTVTSTPSGINCGATCSADFAIGSSVSLTPTAMTGSTFTGWSGDCSGTGACNVTITSAGANVTANFTLDTHTLTVTKAGTGGGTVTSTPGGISCGADCTEPYSYGTSVQLTATPDANSTFTGWSGACTGTGTCTLSITADVTATANFAPIQYQLQVTKAGNGTGTVTASGINCGADCSELYNSGTTVSLTASPGTGSVFSGWSGGGCTGTGGCTVVMSQAQNVTATFTLTQHQLTVQLVGGSASGGVTSLPGGITCGADCTELYDYGTLVNLTATPGTGYHFVGWGGGICTGTGACQVTMTAATTVTATFAINRYTLTVNLAGNGSGQINSSPIGIACGTTGTPDCTEDYDHGTSVTLTPTLTTGTNFTGWSGACTGTGSCVVSMTQAQNVTATFTLQQYTLTVAKIGTGSGGVVSNPPGINCGPSCSKDYDYNTMVTLTATPAYGSTFTGWGSPCAGTGTCVVTITAALTIRANFDPVPPNKVFTMNQTVTPTTLGGIAGADQLCQQAAGNANLQGTFKAYLSSSTSNITDRIGNASGWVRTDGRPFANTKAELLSGKLYSPPRFTQGATDLGNVDLVTGTNASGTYSGAGDCAGYTSVGTGQVTIGRAAAGSSMFVNNGTLSCAATTLRLLCVQIDNQAVVIPTPPSGTVRRAFMRLWGPGGGIADADAKCQSDAQTAGLTGTFKALLPTTTATALSRFDTSANAANWYRVDDMPILPSANAWNTATYFDSGPNLSANGVTNYHNYANLSGASSLTTTATSLDTCNNYTDTTMSARSGTAGTTPLSVFLGTNAYTGCSFSSLTITCLQQ